MFIIFSHHVFSQNLKINIKQNDKIDSLLNKKIKLDREIYEKTYFTLQLYYDNLTTADEISNKSWLLSTGYKAKLVIFKK